MVDTAVSKAAAQACGFESHLRHQKRNPKNKECGAAVADPVRWPPRQRVADGSRQMRISCNPLFIKFTVLF